MLNDSHAARAAMIEGQLRPNGIVDGSVLAAMKLVPREFFVPFEFTGAAYVDEAIPLGNDRMLMEPLVLARLIQALALKGNERVLVLGGALGYSAAVLAHLVPEVVMVEEQPELIAQARTCLPMLGLRNIELVESPLAAPLVSGKFNAILIEGAVQELPEYLLKILNGNAKLAYALNRSLHPGGVKGVPVGLGTLMVAHVHAGMLAATPLAEAGVALLPGFAEKPAFRFA